MKEKHAFIYLNADNKIGSGHFWRCLNIANELTKYKITVKFIYSSLSPILQQILQDSNYCHYEINSVEPDHLIQIIENSERVNSRSLLIIDSDNTYFYEKEFQLSIINSGIGLMIITLNPAFHYYANILLNQNIIGCYQNYATETYTRKLLGPEYFIFNEQFRKTGLKPVKPIGKNIFIAFGSADPCHYTLQLIDQILKAKSLAAYSFHVVIGALNQDYLKIKEVCEKHSDRVNLYYNVSDVSKVMLLCNVAICSPGLMFWELTLMGVRSILCSGSLREKSIAMFLHYKKFAYTFHHYDDVIDEVKFKLLESLLLNLNEEPFNNFSLLRKKLNLEGVSRIGHEINNFLNN
jgi:spore coat polysaccharide biosynthesis predicted glycosyltransferase SpsG